MNRTPFALFTLLCTLATSMVAAGNASRRAGVDHTLTKIGEHELAMTGFLIVLEDKSEPVRDAGRQATELERIGAALKTQLGEVVAYIQAVEAKRIAAAANPTFVKRSPTPSVVLSWFDVDGTVAVLKKMATFDPYRFGAAKAIAGKKATTEPRVTSSVVVQPRFELPAGSPLRSAAVLEVALRPWAPAPTVRIVKPAVLPVAPAAAPRTQAKLTIGSLQSGDATIVVPGIATAQGYWTPALHVADNARSLLGSYYAAPEVAEKPVVKQRTATGWKAASQTLGVWLQQVPAARKAALDGYIAAFGFASSVEKAPIQSAGRPAATQK